MRTFIVTLMASTFAIAGFTAAHAADAVEQVPQPPVAQDAPPPVSNWSGFYLGGEGTYNIDNFKHGGGKGYAFGGAGYTGYNWENNNVVYGVEADLGYSGADATRNGVETKNEFNGSVRGRLGYDFNPFLVYGTAGVAAGRLKTSDATSSDSATGVGWTAGVGAEAPIANNVTARVEYRYTDYGSKGFDLDSGHVSRGFDENSVKVGIGMKF
jgi:outer membrane immunogenic protein